MGNLVALLIIAAVCIVLELILKRRRRKPPHLCRLCRRKPRLIYRNECIDCFYHNHRN